MFSIDGRFLSQQGGRKIQRIYEPAEAFLMMEAKPAVVNLVAKVKEVEVVIDVAVEADEILAVAFESSPFPELDVNVRLAV